MPYKHGVRHVLRIIQKNAFLYRLPLLPCRTVDWQAPHFLKAIQVAFAAFAGLLIGSPPTS